jgi:hypothetical protein
MIVFDILATLFADQVRHSAAVQRFFCGLIS